jgi:hypothetical protein
VKAPEEGKKTRTESVSFRIERSTLDELRKESKQKIESLNVLVNQIFRSYIDIHKVHFLAGSAYFSKTLTIFFAFKSAKFIIHTEIRRLIDIIHL